MIAKLQVFIRAFEIVASLTPSWQRAIVLHGVQPPTTRTHSQPESRQQCFNFSPHLLPRFEHSRYAEISLQESKQDLR